MTIEAASPAPVPAAAPRAIPDRLVPAWRRFAASWEALMIGVAAAVFAVDALASPYFLDPWNLSDATFNFTEKAIIALAMAFVVMAGEIDLSVGGTVALASTAMGAAAAGGAPTAVLVLVGLGVGAACGLFNGFLVARLGLPSIMATVGTMSLYRGLSYVALGDGVYKDYPPGLAWFGQGYVWQMLSFEFASFLVLAVLAGVVLHRTTFGRAVRAIGNNPVASRFSGLRVERIKLLLFVATGLAAGLAAVMLTGRLGSTRPSIALGWELDVVTVVVLGGIDIQGGSGTVPGVVIAALVLGLVTYGLGLLNVPGIIMSIVVGLMLIATIALPILARRVLARRRPA